MELANLVPGFLKPVIRPLYWLLYSLWKNITVEHKSLNEIQRYWKNPWDGMNLPEEYLEGKGRSQFLVELAQKYVDLDARILEIGCNLGRNLNYLFIAGFRNLEGIEISENAISALKRFYPEMARCTTIHNKPVEEIIGSFEENTFDIVFTMAVLQHIHPRSQFIFSDMVRITKKFVITIEAERHISWRHFPRDYKKVFESLGLKEVEEIDTIPELGGYKARIFRKPTIL